MICDNKYGASSMKENIKDIIKVHFLREGEREREWRRGERERKK